MWQFWIIASGIFFVAEIFTAGFLVFWLGVAALIAMISSFITSNIIIQTAIFVIFSVILLFATRPFVNNWENCFSSSRNKSYKRNWTNKN